MFCRCCLLCLFFHVLYTVSNNNDNVDDENKIGSPEQNDSVIPIDDSNKGVSTAAKWKNTEILYYPYDKDGNNKPYNKSALQVYPWVNTIKTLKPQNISIPSGGYAWIISYHFMNGIYPPTAKSVASAHRLFRKDKKSCIGQAFEFCGSEIQGNACKAWCGVNQKIARDEALKRLDHEKWLENHPNERKSNRSKSKKSKKKTKTKKKRKSKNKKSRHDSEEEETDSDITDDGDSTSDFNNESGKKDKKKKHKTKKKKKHGSRVHTLSESQKLAKQPMGMFYFVFSVLFLYYFISFCAFCFILLQYVLCCVIVFCCFIFFFFLFVFWIFLLIY